MMELLEIDVSDNEVKNVLSDLLIKNYDKTTKISSDEKVKFKPILINIIEDYELLESLGEDFKEELQEYFSEEYGL